jgi:plastocyanin
MRMLLLIAATAGAVVTTRGRSQVIVQKDKAFGTTAVTLTKGDSIVFRNDDDVVHNVFSSDPDFKFNLRAQAPKTSAAVAVDKPGTFKVRCAIHPTMKLDVTVTP